jgi:hypothetical protein
VEGTVPAGAGVVPVGNAGQSTVDTYQRVLEECWKSSSGPFAEGHVACGPDFSVNDVVCFFPVPQSESGDARFWQAFVRGSEQDWSAGIHRSFLNESAAASPGGGQLGERPLRPHKWKHFRRELRSREWHRWLRTGTVVHIEACVAGSSSFDTEMSGGTSAYGLAPGVAYKLLTVILQTP